MSRARITRARHALPYDIKALGTSLYYVNVHLACKCDLQSIDDKVYTIYVLW